MQSYKLFGTSRLAGGFLFIQKRREPKFPPVNGMKSGGYFA